MEYRHRFFFFVSFFSFYLANQNLCIILARGSLQREYHVTEAVQDVITASYAW